MRPRGSRRRTPLPAVQFPPAAAMYAQGYSLAAVAEEFATTAHWVRKAVEAQGGAVRRPGGRTVPGRPFDLAKARELYLSGKTVRQVAAELGDSRCRVHAQLVAAGVPMRDMTASRASRITSAKREAILAACREGKSIRRVCVDVRTSPGTIERVLEEAGLPKPARRRLDRQRMRELRDLRWTYKRIGEDQGTSPQYAWRIVTGADKRQHDAGGKD